MHVHNVQIIEEDHTLSIRIKYIKGKFSKPGNILVTQQQTDGSTLETTYKIPLEKIIIEENLKKYHHTKVYLPLLDDLWLYQYIGDFGEVPNVEAILDGTYVCPDNTDQEVK